MSGAAEEDTRLEALIAGCEQEPLQLSGAIQPHGTLIVLEPDGVVSHAAENTAAILGIPAFDLLGRPAIERLGFPAPRLLDPESPPGTKVLSAQPVELEGRPFLASLTAREGGWLLELLPGPGGEHEAGRGARLAQRLVRPPARDEELADYYRRAAGAVRELTGFDRVMIYRFHDDWSGEVVAEDGDPGFGSYIGLRFPASDIPKVARDLYQVTGSRLIPDVEAPPVPLLAADPQAPPPDLTHTDLRSVSPLHVRYLQNMAVGASFSLAITLRGTLWGLVACHHRSPREIRPAVRRSCREVADAFALGIMGHSSMSRMRLIDQAEHRVDGVLPATGHGLPTAEVLAARASDIQALVGATGVAILLDPERVAHGRVPPPEALAAIDAWFLSQREDLLATDHLESRLPAAAAWHDSASGLLAMRVRIAHSHASDWLRVYWTRPEVPRTVHWAGRPEKSMVRVGGRDMLNPRKSFDAWTEVTRGRSEPWAQAEQILAMRLRARLLARSRGG